MHYHSAKSETEVEEVGFVERRKEFHKTKQGEAPGVLTVSSTWEMEQVSP